MICFRPGQGATLGMQYRSINPATGEELRAFPLHRDAEVERAIDEVAHAFGRWCREPVARRADRLLAASEILDRDAEDLARIMALEMGKPLAQGVAEARKCASGCRFYAENAIAWMEPDSRESDGSAAWVRYEPLGPVLAIMPWNFPFWQVFRFAAPALAAGNTGLLKHASNVPGCALAIEQVLQSAGTPDGVFQTLLIGSDRVEPLIRDPRVRAVTLTGSDFAGRSVARAAGDSLKKTVLELGGSDPFVVFEDAELGRAIEVGVDARCQNNGQSCIAAKRFLIHRSRFETYCEGFVERMRSRVVGPPLDAGVQIGPLARSDLRDTLALQVERTATAGARLLCGGTPIDGPGYFYPPTVMVDLPADSPGAQEELFGPVATLQPFDDEDHAVELANATRYGLGASLWTADTERARRIVPRIEAGSVFVNGLVKSDPRLPFGGVKDSGFGRELGREGMREFVNVKTVWIA